MIENVIEYKMNEQEAFAYKLCLLWEKIIYKELKNHDKKGLVLPKNGDPRKSSIFKYCFKLARETKGLIKNDEYKYYLYAQVVTLKNFHDGKIHSMITPSCICGEKAWLRWSIWKSKIDKKMLKASTDGDITDIKATVTDIEIELNRSRKFFISVFGENYTKDKVEKAIKEKEIVKWISFNRISVYYLLLSPLIKKHYQNIDDSFSIDSEILKKSINEQIENYFKKIFSCEFN